MDTDPGNLVAVLHHLKLLVSQIKLQGELTFGEFCVMSMIDRETLLTKHKLTPTSLNEMLGTKKPATSRMLTLLEKKGFVMKQSDEKDHRIFYLALTDQGSIVLSQERDNFHELLIRISKRIGIDEIDQITSTLLRLSNILEEELEVAANW
jgi:DNA-binding MarR family transcriptional regulator